MYAKSQGELITGLVKRLPSKILKLYRQPRTKYVYVRVPVDSRFMKTIMIVCGAFSVYADIKKLTMTTLNVDYLAHPLPSVLSVLSVIYYRILNSASVDLKQILI
jgi:hypothetical protein